MMTACWLVLVGYTACVIAGLWLCFQSRDPALTQAEREALEIAVEYVGSAYAVEHHAKAIERLLERTR
jgi:hypothetical protein